MFLCVMNLLQILGYQIIRKYIVLPLIGLNLCISSCRPVPVGSTVTENGKILDSLYHAKDFFRMKTSYDGLESRLSEYEKLYYGSVLKNLFNEPGESLSAIAELEQRFGKKITDSTRSALWQLQLSNYIKRLDYRNAARVSRLILGNYTAYLDSATLSDIRNELNIWKALEKVPAVKASVNTDHRLLLTLDKAGLKNTTVRFGSDSVDFIFDTGANFSVIRRSVAEKAGLKIMETDFLVGTITGEQVKSRLAVAPQIHMGSITWHNVVFLVFDDNSLTIPQIDYHIYGILGFPEIRSLREIRISKDNILTVPARPTAGQPQNLYFDGLMPIIAARHGGDTLAFSFDSGASTTHLYPKFYEKYQRAIDTLYTITSIAFGGAGGVQEFTGVENVALDLELGGKYGQLDNIALIVDERYTEKRGIFGNLGQDFIGLFGGFAINFETSSLWFE